MPSSFQISIKMDDELRPAVPEKAANLAPDKISTFNDDRIAHHQDKQLLQRIRAFFKTFTTGDFDGMRDLQSENYTMTNIRKQIHILQ